MGDGPNPKATNAERDDLQRPIVHEGAPSGHHDGNEVADDRVEVVEPDGSITPRRYIREGRGSDQIEGSEEPAADADPGAR